MDGLPRALDEALLKELECPVCMEYMVPPITLCTNGHNICSKCRGTVKCCFTCRAEFAEVRSVALENIARRLKYPCANRQSGCLEFFSCEHIAEHHTVCVYGKIRCPFKLVKNCSWNGLKSDLKKHAKVAHLDRIFESPAINSALFEDRIMCLISCLGQLFVYYKRVRDGRMYCAVQLIGTISEASKYKCEFTLRAANGVEQITNTLFVRGYSEDFETIFNSGKCLRLDEEVVRNYFVGKHINMTVTLSTV
jgi:E3 ubiquitin-protein ligase SIAH1